MPFEISILGKGQCRFDMLAIREVPLDFVGMRRTDYLLGLISKSLGHFLMHSLHFPVRHGRQFVIARLVRCDLGGSSPFDALLFKVGLDLLTPGARGIKVLASVAGDFRLSAFASLNLVALTIEAER
jgi:hypothetical protein